MSHDLAWLLVLLLRSVLKETAGQTPPPGFRYASYEVVIPEKQNPRYGHREPQHVNYLLQVEGKSRMVYLRQKRPFVPKHFPLFTYSKEGDLQVDYPFIRDDCFYDGFVHGMPASSAALSTCSGGLRGVLHLGNKSYEIEPVPASGMFQHVVYRLEEEEGAIRMRCGLTEEEQLQQAAMIPNAGNVMTERSQDRPWWTHLMHARLAIVVDHERYVQFGRNETVVALNMLYIMQLLNGFYADLGLHLTLVGLEIWSERNLINISNKIGEVLGAFNTWRNKNLQSRLPHDAGHFILYKHFGSTGGVAFVGTMCYQGGVLSVAVDVYTIFSSYHFATTVAHEQAHLLGIGHDTNLCTCEWYNCIMVGYQSFADQFSNCSYKDYYGFLKSGRAQCLFSARDPDKQYKLAYCGNRVVERGESCDCGSRRDCRWDPCCQPNCRFRPHAICASGPCCSNCWFLSSGTVCRKATNVCDLPEYCLGYSTWCPDDVYVQDGTPCEDGGFCYHGKCSTHIKQCKMIFGSSATVGSGGCFRELNTRGDRFGNCGINGANYKKCNLKDVLCGRIQCENVNELPLLKEHSTIIQTKVYNSLCWGTDSHPGTRLPDIGAVIDGTPCGEDMICINKECTVRSLSQHDCNMTKCQNRGICNSHEHCHCEYGWAPPYCLDKGHGGSTDSGPPPPHKGSAIFSRELAISLASVLIVAIGAGLGVYFGSNVIQ